ncbi:MAG TPA: hypothetical protein EYP49_15000 [Anaerolineae bacterium]|nr:hypothetical protein [Anaerolineae bacterium]
MTILVNALLYGDDVVCAAEARALQGAPLSEAPSVGHAPYRDAAAGRLATGTRGNVKQSPV